MAGTGEMAAGLSFAVMALGGGIILSLFAFRDLFLLGALVSVRRHRTLLVAYSWYLDPSANWRPSNVRV